MPNYERIVVVGASLAGLRACEALRRDGFAGVLSLVGEEEHFPPYDRPPLSKELLKGLWEPERLRLRATEGLDLDLHLGRRAVSTELDQGRITLDDGSELAFDGLIVATGAAPRLIPGVERFTSGVHVLRTFEDCIGLREAFEKKPRVAIIGAGWIGCEVAASCRELGLEVSVVEFLNWPMERTLGPVMGEWAAGVHTGHGVDMRLGVGVTGILGDSVVEGLSLADGSSVEAEVVIVAIGVAPSTGWLEGSGLDIDNGVLCDATLRAVGAENIVAAGDVARWYNPQFDTDMRVEHWSNAVEQASAAAKTLLSDPGTSEAFSTVPYVWSDQYDLKLQYVGIAGEFAGVVEGSLEDRKFVALFSSDDRAVGALCVNSPARMIRYKRRLADRPSLTELKAGLP